MPHTLSNELTLGTPAADFLLPDTTGRLHALADFADKPALLVVFLSNRCPFVIHIREHFARFAREYGERGLQVIGINANDPGQKEGESLIDIADQVQTAGYTFPYLKDIAQDVAKAYGAACTPDFFLFDQERKLAYHGQYDASRPSNDTPVTGTDLQAAVEAVLEGQAPSSQQVSSIGCNIKWQPGNEPSWFSTAA